MARSGSRKLEVSPRSDTEILYKRVFEAPRHLVFAALTQPEHVRRWWCCMEGYTMTVCEADLRPGGRWRYAMVGPDGAEMAFHGVYRELAPERIVHTEIFELFPDVESVMTATLVERDGKTYYDAVQVFPSKEARDGVLASGMEVGADLAYDRLEEIAQALATGTGVAPAHVPARA